MKRPYSRYVERRRREYAGSTSDMLLAGARKHILQKLADALKEQQA